MTRQIGEAVLYIGLAAVTVINILTLAGAIGRRRAARRQRHDDQAIAVTRPPAPAPPPGPPRGAQLPVPGHRSPPVKRIHVHRCGCIWTWDAGTRRWERTYDCQRLDEELRRLAP
jgi:hypothetical protein